MQSDQVEYNIDVDFSEAIEACREFVRALENLRQSAPGIPLLSIRVYLATLALKIILLPTYLISVYSPPTIINLSLHYIILRPRPPNGSGVVNKSTKRRREPYLTFNLF